MSIAFASALAACSDEPPTPVSRFMEDSILLEATMVRCTENRVETRYDTECLNAREAVDRIAAREEQAQRAELEARSERKRRAVREAQDAAAEARRRALEQQEKRQEAELLGPFAPIPAPITEGEAPPGSDSTDEDAADSSADKERPGEDAG